MVKITGRVKHTKRLKSLASPKTAREIGKILFALSDDIRVEAQYLIAKDSIQGEGHVPSKPGEPPNWDTGVLAGGITNRRVGPLMALVESSAPYAVHQEIGTSKMAARPYMKPAAKKHKGGIARKIGATINVIARRG